ncbi:MAG: DUF433 domain-containing protein [Planctomycetota bacterium]
MAATQTASGEIETASGGYVRRDEQGVLRVGESRLMVDLIVEDFHRGLSPGAICRNYQGLTLEQVYGVIAHYLAHRDEIDGYLEQRKVEADRVRGAIESARPKSSAVERLRATRSSDSGASS